jgi:hypothetical protein
MKEKKCSKCKFIKLINEFNKATRRKDGLQLQCRDCIKTTAKKLLH